MRVQLSFVMSKGDDVMKCLGEVSLVYPLHKEQSKVTNVGSFGMQGTKVVDLNNNNNHNRTVNSTVGTTPRNCGSL